MGGRARFAHSPTERFKLIWHSLSKTHRLIGTDSPRVPPPNTKLFKSVNPSGILQHTAVAYYTLVMVLFTHMVSYYWDMFVGPKSYRLFPTQLPMDVFVVSWNEEGQDMRDFFSPGRSLVSMAFERSICRWWCRSVSEYPRCLILMGVRGCLQRCCGGFRVACPSRGTGSERERLFFEHGGGSIIVKIFEK